MITIMLLNAVNLDNLYFSGLIFLLYLNINFEHYDKKYFLKDKLQKNIFYKNFCIVNDFFSDLTPYNYILKKDKKKDSVIPAKKFDAQQYKLMMDYMNYFQKNKIKFSC